jgi:Ca-activated chloride channel homolog
MLLLLALRCAADSGVLLPEGRHEPDASVFSLDEMVVDILIDNGDAGVSIRQVFGNHTGSVLEGNYTFALPSRGLVSDFAVWDDVTRIPGVIIERRRAEEIYDSLRWQSIDPGLLQQGEREAGEAARSDVFSARIMPIPAFGTKRLEIGYHQRIAVENLGSEFALLLRPSAYRAQTAGRLVINLELRSGHAIRDFEPQGKLYPLRIVERDAHVVKAAFEGQNVSLGEDFAVRYEFDSARADTLDVITYRDPSANEPGYFEASALVADTAPAAARKPRTIIALFDASLSMQWEKLERSFHALDSLLHSLGPTDRFNVLVFNTEVAPFAPAPVPAEIPVIEKALEFVRSNNLRGGTDLQAVLARALAQPLDSDAYIVLFSDAGATRGTVSNSKLADWYAVQWKQSARPRTYVFGIGDDANLPLIRMLARNDGIFESVCSSEPIDFKLNAFLGRIGRRALSNLALSASPESNFDLVYPLDEAVFPGSVAAWVGQYRRPATQAAFTVRGARDGSPLEMRTAVALPQQSLDHPQVPRTWAKARVDALLEKIERSGEDRASIDEIIRLSRKYKFVTPYTSFLAVPRALLRPRVIRPGDPVLRVRTDPDIVSVVALFPFGLIKPLRYLDREDTWQTRFLAPTDMADGSYSVRLILRDRVGHVYREAKTFVIASKPPTVRVLLPKTRYRRGETVPLRVRASQSTRTISAHLYGAAPVFLRWNQQAGANTGELVIPAALPAGKYRLNVTAEDIAHNIGTGEVSLEILP